jgi:RsiW-degrading membrane proteinase PrsW (M82 family)
VLVFVAALGIVAAGFFAGLLSLAMALLAEGNQRLAGTTLSLSILGLTAGLGLPLAWHAWRAMQGRPSSTFRPRSPWPLVGAFLLAVTAGLAVLELELLPALLFPPLHLVAALTPPLLILVLVARGLGGAGRWRDAVLQLSSGSFLATPLAFLVEGAFLFGLLVLLMAWLALQPGGQEMLQALSDRLAENPSLQDPEVLLPLLTSPGVILATLLIIGLLVPVVEELVKAVGVVLVAYRRPNAREAMLWGLAGGAGFAMVEALFNTTGSLPTWAPTIVLRVGASVLHCAAGALMGLAWQQLLVRRSWAPALGLYLAAVAMHAAWNTVTVGVAFLSLGTLSPEGAGVAGGPAALGTVALIGVLVVLSAGMVVLLAVLTRRLAGPGRAEGEQASHPLPAGD